MINIDLSCLIVLGILTVLNVLLNRILYKPILSNFHQRRDHIVSLRKEARSNSETARIIRLETHALLTTARRRANAEKRRRLDETEAEAQQRVADAVARCNTSVENHRQTLRKEMDAARSHLTGQSKEISAWIRNKLVPVCLAVFLGICSGYAMVSGAQAADPYFDPGERREVPDIGVRDRDSDRAGETRHPVTILTDLEKAFNLFILIVLLFFFLHKPVSRFFDHRKTTVRRALESTEHELTFSSRELQTAEKERGNIDSAKKSIRRKCDRESRIKREEILKEAEQKIRRIEERARKIRRSIEQDIMLDLNRDVVMETVGRVMDDFSIGLDADIDRRLVNECIRQLETLPPHGGAA